MIESDKPLKLSPQVIIDRDFWKERVQCALDIAIQFGGIDGVHHKSWVIDQIVRELAGDRYEELVRNACIGTGIAPEWWIEEDE